MFKKYKFLGIILSLSIILIILSGCSNKKVNNSSQKIKIVTTTNFYAEAAKAVVGDKGTVNSIINNPAVDPHDYEPTTKTAKTVSAADITVANGLGYDTWMNKLNKQSNSYIKIGEDVMHKKTGNNPHIWYNPETMPRYAKYLADQLGNKYPKNKAYFEQNAQEYIASLKPIQKELSQLKTLAQKVPNKNVYVSEPVFDYAIAATGFKVTDKNFEKAIENGTDPTPSTIKKMHQAINNKQIAFFVLNTQTNNKVINNLVSLAEKKNIPILKVTETLPEGKTYKEWMLSQYQAMNKILKSEE
ncbi:MAG TPA: metal ABC transporter substrate-binding protein [Lactobacillus sp.]|nr:metal ABC transporter substrate-binding protein [Lactobacillus sp.]